MSVLVPALIGLSVFAFHMGVSRESVLDSVSTEILGNLFAALILAPLCFVKSRKPVSVLLFSGVAPVAAAMLLSYMAIASDFEVLENFTSTGIYTFFCMIAQISLALGIAGTHAQEFSARMIWSGFTLLFTIFSISGISLGALLSDKQPLIPQTITALYCAILLSSRSVHFGKTKPVTAVVPRMLTKNTITPIAAKNWRTTSLFRPANRKSARIWDEGIRVHTLRKCW